MSTKTKTVREVGFAERRLDTDEAAELLGLQPGTLATWRWSRKGPPYRKHGRKVWYLERELLAWSERHAVNPEGVA